MAFYKIYLVNKAKLSCEFYSLIKISRQYRSIVRAAIIECEKTGKISVIVWPGIDVIIIAICLFPSRFYFSTRLNLPNAQYTVLFYFSFLKRESNIYELASTIDMYYIWYWHSSGPEKGFISWGSESFLCVVFFKVFYQW